MAMKAEEVLGIALAKIEAGGGGGGTTNYNSLDNKPQINGVTLEGNKTPQELGITAVRGVYNNENLSLQ